MDVIMQKLMELEEKINYLISLQQPKSPQPQFQTQQFSQQQAPFQVPPPVIHYQQSVPQTMPNYPERLFPTGIEHQRFGALTRGSNKS